MPLFKILRGNKAALSSAEQHDGWAYFTPDTKGFYINASGNLLKINDRVEMDKFTITPAMLSTKSFTVNLSLLNLSNTITKDLYYIEMDLDVNDEAYQDLEKRFLLMAALEKANLHYEITADNEVTISCYGKYDGSLSDGIPMIIKFIPYEHE